MKRLIIALLISFLIIVTVLPSGAWSQAVRPTASIEHPNSQTTSLISPTLLWSDNMTDNVTDIAVGYLNGDEFEDVVAIDNALNPTTIDVFRGEGDGSGNGSILWSQNVSGYAVAVGDINDDERNEIVASDFGNGLIAYWDNGTEYWHYNTIGLVKDIEIADIDGNGINDVIACNNETGPGRVYAIDGITGLDLPGGWPKDEHPYDYKMFMDVAVGNLDDSGGMDVAAIGREISGSLYVFSSGGDLLWEPEVQIEGRTVEIGDVDGDGYNEVVAGTDDGWVYAYKGTDGTLLYSFNAHSPVTDVELGDLDGEPNSALEVACIDNGIQNTTLYALDIDNETNTPESQIMWTYPMYWDSQYYGESIAIGDVDRDYKNEVIACSSVAVHEVYAFDGLDNNGDGIGDLVWQPFVVPMPGDEIKDDPKITDLEIGDLDGDGDNDVVIGTDNYTGYGGKVIALAGPESQTQTATLTGSVYFDSDPSTIEDLQEVSEGSLPAAGKPPFNYPLGFFSFKITGLDDSQTATVTVTLPSPAPVGTKWVKYQNGEWSILDIGDDDGDNVITYLVTDGGIGDAGGETDGTIIEPGGPGFPRLAKGVGGEVVGINKTSLIATWVALVLLVSAGVVILVLRRRKVF